MRLFIIIVLAVSFIAVGIVLLVYHKQNKIYLAEQERLRQARIDEEARQEFIKHEEETTTKIGDKPLEESRIKQIQKDSDATYRMMRIEAFNNKVAPLKEYLKQIEEDHNSGKLTDEDYQKECACINKTIDDFCKEYGMEENNV